MLSTCFTSDPVASKFSVSDLTFTVPFSFFVVFVDVVLITLLFSSTVVDLELPVPSLFTVDLVVTVEPSSFFSVL